MRVFIVWCVVVVGVMAGMATPASADDQWLAEYAEGQALAPVRMAVSRYLAEVAAFHEYLEAGRQAEIAAEALRRQSVASQAVSAASTGWPTSLYPCDGPYPPCQVKWRESHGDYNAQNPTSSASGAWQFLDSTWGGYGGYARAVDAPPSIQDAKAAALWAGGSGCSHWSAC